MKNLKNKTCLLIASLFNLFVLSGCQSCGEDTGTTPTVHQQNDITASLLYTGDGGSTWTKQTINLVKELRALTSLSPGALTTVGQNASVSQVIYDGVVLHRTYMDTAWIKQTSIQDKILYDITATSVPGKGIAVGNGASILLTSNDGVTWTPVPNPFSPLTEINAVAFANQFIGVAVASSGEIVRTSNGGISWSIVNPSTSITFHDVEFINFNTVIAVGHNIPRVYKSTDSGLSWNPVTPGVSNDLNAVSFMEGTGFGIAVSVFSKIFKTDDYGNTWRDIPLSQSFQPYNVIVLENGNCIAVGYGPESNILRSTDYGENWYSVVHPSSGTLYGIHFEGTDAGWVVGD